MIGGIFLMEMLYGYIKLFLKFMQTPKNTGIFYKRNMQITST